MSDEETGPVEPEAPAPPPEQGRPAYAMPVPAGSPEVTAASPRPRFADQVMGMRAVVATAVACLIVGGLGGFALGHADRDDGGRFGHGPGFFHQRGAFPQGPGGPGGFSHGRGGSSDRSGGPSGQMSGAPQQRLSPSQSPSSN
jgi:hypothetical protein